MAGNAAGFSGLQLPSSSSILLFHLPYLSDFSSCSRLAPSLARQADAAHVYVFTALVSTTKRGNGSKGDRLICM